MSSKRRIRTAGGAKEGSQHRSQSASVAKTEGQPKVEPKVETVAKAEPKRGRGRPSQQQPMVQSGVETKYAGGSPVVNKTKSRTAIPVDTFGQHPSRNVSDRSLDLLRGIKGKFGNNEFELADMDRGIVKILGQKGYLRYVDGDPASASCKFAVTPEGMAAG